MGELKEEKRLGSRLGFILLSAGCAIGLGNVWKFPYVTGENGGAIFLIIYLVFLLIFGIPIMSMEFAIGRASQRSPVGMYKELEPPKSKWHIFGIFTFIGCIVLMMYYSVVAGWIINYFVKFLTGKFAGADVEKVNNTFSSLMDSPVTMVMYMLFVVLIGFTVCGIGLQNGLEKITKYMMILLMTIMIVLAIKAFTLSEAKEGLKFFLYPNVESVKKIGIVSIIFSAIKQAFFTLSLGIGGMAVFGAYIGKDRRLLGESVNITILDTVVAVMAGIIIFPACFSYGIAPDSGPRLLFIAMPNVFINMPFGSLWGSLFFIFMSFAALSTVFAVFENILASFIELTKISRRKACIICGIGIFLLSIPCALGFNVWKDVKLFGSLNILGIEDYIVSNLLLPIGSLINVCFCTWSSGWGWKNFISEVNEGKGLKFPEKLRIYAKVVIPFILIIVLITSFFS